MDPRAQIFLVKLLVDTYTSTRRSSSKHRSAWGVLVNSLEAFRAVEAASAQEVLKWERWMSDAIGAHDAPTIGTDPGTSHRTTTRFVGHSDVATRHTTPGDLVLQRSIDGPFGVVDFLESSFIVTGLELFDTGLAIVWQLEPLPPATTLFPRETAALDQMLEGLADSDREALSDWAQFRFRTTTDIDMTLIDDGGTSYLLTHSKSRLDLKQQSGWSYFEPAPASRVTRLSVGWILPQVQPTEIPLA
jgi:hypothetical protein